MDKIIQQQYAGMSIKLVSRLEGALKECLLAIGADETKAIERGMLRSVKYHGHPEEVYYYNDVPLITVWPPEFKTELVDNCYKTVITQKYTSHVNGVD